MLRKLFLLLPWLPCGLAAFWWIAHDIQTNKPAAGLAMFAIMGIGMIQFALLMLSATPKKNATTATGRAWLAPAKTVFNVVLFLVGGLAALICADLHSALPQSKFITVSARRIYDRETHASPGRLLGQKKLYGGRMAFKSDDAAVAERLFVRGEEIFRSISLGERVTLRLQVADSLLFGSNTYLLGVSLAQ